MHRSKGCLIAALLLESSVLQVAPAAAPRIRSMVIVVPEALQESIQPYVAFKSRQRTVRLFTLDQIVHTPGPADDAEKLKRFLYDQWRHDTNIGYLLLVGDCNIMPVRYTACDKYTHPKTPGAAASGWAFYACDTYYAALSKPDGSFDDWNGFRKGVHARFFGEVNGDAGAPVNLDQISVHPVLAVGRWPVSTPAEVRIVADKSMLYETGIREGRHPGMHKAWLANVGGWADVRPMLSQVKIPGWNIELHLFKDKDDPASTTAPNENNLVAALNEGVGLVAHVGHGSRDTWLGFPSSYKDAQGRTHIDSVLSTYHTLGELHNGDRLPVMFSCGCDTAYVAPIPPMEPYVDEHGTQHKGTWHGEEGVPVPPPVPSVYQTVKLQLSLAKRLLKDGPNGAVAYIGGIAFGQPPDVALLEGFLNALGTVRGPTVGDCFARSIDFYYKRYPPESMRADDNWPVPAQFSQGLKFMLYGDPSLPMVGLKPKSDDVQRVRSRVP